MIRLAFTVIAGVLLGLIVHLVAVLALPRIATQDAYSRLTPTTKLNAVTQLALPDPSNAPMPFMDPAFAVAICRYDLSDGPIKLAVPVSQAYTSVSFYTRSEVAYYAINDRSAGRKVIELDLMTEAQHADLPEEEDVTSADRLIIDSPTTTGLIVMKALAAEPGLMPQAQASLAAASCQVQSEAPAKQPEPPPTPAPRPSRR
jgi:uncharacterized membrane protein